MCRAWYPGSAAFEAIKKSSIATSSVRVYPRFEDGGKIRAGKKMISSIYFVPFRQPYNAYKHRINLSSDKMASESTTEVATREVRALLCDKVACSSCRRREFPHSMMQNNIPEFCPSALRLDCIKKSNESHSFLIGELAQHVSVTVYCVAFTSDADLSPGSGGSVKGSFSHNVVDFLLPNCVQGMILLVITSLIRNIPFVVL